MPFPLDMSPTPPCMLMLALPVAAATGAAPTLSEGPPSPPSWLPGAAPLLLAGWRGPLLLLFGGEEGCSAFPCCCCCSCRCECVELPPLAAPPFPPPLPPIPPCLLALVPHAGSPAGAAPLLLVCFPLSSCLLLDAGPLLTAPFCWRVPLLLLLLLLGGQEERCSSLFFCCCCSCCFCCCCSCCCAPTLLAPAALAGCSAGAAPLLLACISLPSRTLPDGSPLLLLPVCWGLLLLLLLLVEQEGGWGSFMCCS